MAPLKIHFLPSALNDANTITDGLMNISIPAAERFKDELIKRVAQLKMFPKSGSIVQDVSLPKARIRLLTMGDYLIFYRVTSTEVRVYRILHHYQERKSILE